MVAAPLTKDPNISGPGGHLAVIPSCVPERRPLSDPQRPEWSKGRRREECRARLRPIAGSDPRRTMRDSKSRRPPLRPPSVVRTPPSLKERLPNNHILQFCRVQRRFVREIGSWGRDRITRRSGWSVQQPQYPPGRPALVSDGGAATGSRGGLCGYPRPAFGTPRRHLPAAARNCPLRPFAGALRGGYTSGYGSRRDLQRERPGRHAGSDGCPLGAGRSAAAGAATRGSHRRIRRPDGRRHRLSSRTVRTPSLQRPVASG